MTSSATNPFSGEIAREVPLKNAPLVRVIAQVRFPVLVAVDQSEAIAPLQRALRDSYPLLRKEQIQHLLIGPAGAAPQDPMSAWRFSDANDVWRVTLTRDFVTLETTAYTSRSDFLVRFRQIVDVVGQHLAPPQMDRLGVRYIDRIRGDALTQITTLLRPEMRGISGSNVDSFVNLAISEAVFQLDESRLRARWGKLPENSTVDPAALEAISEPSWILDLDMFSTSKSPYDPTLIVSNASKFAERIYSFFRWAVTEEFLRKYGGSP